MRISDWSSDVCSSDLQVYGSTADYGLRHRGLREGVGRHDRGSRLFPAARWRGKSGIQSSLRLVDGQRHANHAGRGNKHIRRLATEMPRNPRRDSLDSRAPAIAGEGIRSEEHTSELQSLMRISYAVFCL